MIAKIKLFISEVRTELLKASWPWDPKERGFKKYKELVDSTMVVVVAMLLLAGFISSCDFCLTSIVGFLTNSGPIGPK
jgi:preprotein translocase subunit SecE